MSETPELPASAGTPPVQKPIYARPLALPAQLGVRLRWLWLFLALAAAALYPAFTQNIAALAYDAALEHVPRGLLFSQAIDDGALYPRWVQFLHLGLGSPLFTFQGPLPYYGLDLLYRLGLPHPIGWRLLIGGGLLAAAVGAYLFVRLLTGSKWPALLAAMAYLYAPYVLRNALERGSNEAFSVFLYPWVLWALLWLARRPSAGRFLGTSLLWAGCIGAHVLGPLMLAPVAALVGALAAWRYRTVAPLGALFAGGLLMAAVWAPMVPEQQWVHVERDFSQPEAIPLQNSIPVDRLLSPPSLYDATRDANGSGDRVGLLQTVLLVLGIPAALYAWRRGRRDLAAYLGIATALGLLLFWMFTGASDFIWRLAGPLLAGLLYRTRLMGLQALAVACAGGCALALFPPRWQRTLGIGVALLLILAALPSLYVGLQHNYAYFEDTLSLAQVRATELKVGGRALTAFGEFAPIWRSRPLDQTLLDEVGRDQDPQVRPLADPPPGVTVEDVRVRSSAWDLAVQADRPVTLTLYLFYYPRWQATVDGLPVSLRPQAETGYAQLAVPAGRHQVALRYGGTAAETAGLAVSGLTLLGLLSAWGLSLARRGRRLRRVGEWESGEEEEAPSAPAVPRPSGGEVSSLPAISLRTGGVSPPPASSPVISPSPRAQVAPSVWLLLALSGLLAIKFLYIDPSTTWLRCVSTAERVCGAQATTSVAFEGGMRLRGYSVLSPEVSGDGVLRVDLYWQNDRPGQPPVGSFVHLRNSRPDWPADPHTGSDIWVQADHYGPGGFFTTDYLAGRIYLDEYRIPVPVDVPAGEYFLEVGLADLGSGEQVEPVPDSVVQPMRILWRSVLLPAVQVK